GDGIGRIRHPDRRPQFVRDRFFQVFFNFKSAGAVTWTPIDRLYIKMLSLSAVGPRTDVLNDFPTEIELLSLRRGAVALMGHNLVDPAGQYAYFEMNLAQKGRVEWGDEKAD